MRLNRDRAKPLLRTPTDLRNCKMRQKLFVGPKVRDYVTRLEGEIAAKGFAADLRIMASNGGVATPAMVSERYASSKPKARSARAAGNIARWARIPRSRRSAPNAPRL